MISGAVIQKTAMPLIIANMIFEKERIVYIYAIAITLAAHPSTMLRMLGLCALQRFPLTPTLSLREREFRHLRWRLRLHATEAT